MKDLFADLYIEGDEYKEYREKYKKDYKKVVKTINTFNKLGLTLIPVFESDSDREKDYLDEQNYEMQIITNINGILLYKRLSKEVE